MVKYNMGQVLVGNLRSWENDSANALMIGDVDRANTSLVNLEAIYSNSVGCFDTLNMNHVKTRIQRFNECIGEIVVKKLIKNENGGLNFKWD